MQINELEFTKNFKDLFDILFSEIEVEGSHIKATGGR
jgi:hypothetical protein